LRSIVSISREGLKAAEGRYDKAELVCPEAAPHSLGRRLASEEMSMLSDGPIGNPDGT